jgi:hypothetical protein
MKTFRYCLLVFSALASTMVYLRAQEPKNELRILFIGNSFTFTNDLPAIVEALAQASKQKRLIYQAVVFPSLGLKEQWQRGDAQKAIASSKWDVVVLQQGPSTLEESRRLLLEYTRLFDKEIRASGAKTALYMVWPSEARISDFDRVVESYKLAADEVKAILFPVGQAWREALGRDASIGLYSEDRFHPSVAGSYLASLVIYEKLFGKSSVGLPASLKLRSKTLEKIELPQEHVELLQVAATEANKKF